MRSWIVAAVALLGAAACGPPRQRSLHTLEVGDDVQSLAFAPNGSTLACALTDRILLIDAERGARLRELGPLPNQHRAASSGILHVGEVCSLTASLWVAFSRERLLSAGEDRYVRLWDIRRGVETARFESGSVGVLAISPNGRWLVTRPMQVEKGMPGGVVEVVANPAAATITIWDLDHHRRSPPIQGTPQPVEALAINADGLVAVGRGDMTIDTFDAASTNLVSTLHGERPYYERLTALAFRPDKPRVLAVGDSDGHVRTWDVPDRRLLENFSGDLGDPFDFVSPRLLDMAFAAHGGVLAVGGSRGIATVWRVGASPEREPRVIARLSDYSALARLTEVNLVTPVTAVAVNRAASLVATGYRGGRVRIWRGPEAR